MNCQEFKADLYAFIEEQLDEERRAAVAGHAEACEPCGGLLQRWREMTCKDFVDFLQAHFDGELDAETARVFQRHLEACPPCVDYLDAYKKTVALGREVCRDDNAIPADVPTALVRAVLDAHRRMP